MSNKALNFKIWIQSEVISRFSVFSRLWTVFKEYKLSPAVTLIGKVVYSTNKAQNSVTMTQIDRQALEQEAQRATYRAPEYNVPHLLPHLGFLIGPKNTNFVEDTEILLSINFRQIQFSRFRAVLSKKKMPFADSMSLTLCKSYLSSNAKLVYISRAQNLCKSYLSFNANCPIKS